jgi:N-acetylmuramoyl-L-alanine amidase
MLILSLLLSLSSPVHAAFPAPEKSTAPITIVFPAENSVLGPADAAWLIGNVSEPKGLFKINGETITVHPDGAWLAWVPVAPGTFTFSATLSVGTSFYAYQRVVDVLPPQAPLPAKPVAFDNDSLTPRADLELRPGDWLLTRAKVSPGAKPEFRLGRKGAWQPMREVVPALGIYEGAYLLRTEDETTGAPVQFRAQGHGGAAATAPGKVTVTRATPLVGVLRGQNVVMVRTGPGEGDLFPAIGGTRFVVGGRQGNELKLLLSNGQTGWIDGKTVEMLLPGAHPPRAETETVGVRSGERESTVRVGLGDRVPFIVEENEDLTAVTVRLHYTYLHTNWIVYPDNEDFVDEVRLKQETSDIVAMTVKLKPGKHLWGYWAGFEGNALKLELRKPPRLAKKGSPLSGVRVFLDPGHMPSAPGAIGPLGTKEMDINLAIAREAEALLKADGAVPILSRKDEKDEVSLVDRPKLAVEKKADVFVSVHNNFLPGSSNPFRGGPHGYSIFYYHPHSLELARAVYEGYHKRVPLSSEELRFGDYLVLRNPAMPAILTESAYLTYPEQEAMLLEEPFRKKLAAAIVDGLRAYFKDLRDQEKRR